TKKSVFLRILKTSMGLWGLGLSCFSTTARPELLEIIHTNDLHSHFERASSIKRGGYAAIKIKIDQLKAEAAAQGIESLILDSGDFTEGSIFYQAEAGRRSWELLDSIGYDAVTIGNHDWLVGVEGLDNMLQSFKPGFHFLGANFIFDGKFKALRDTLKPFAEFTRSGKRIAVLGLTTNEMLYTWLIGKGQGYVLPPESEAYQDLPPLVDRNDLVIALSHLGIKGDESLAKKSLGIDLIVGGHSHTELFEPIYINNPVGVPVPIVQTGHSGDYVGDLLVDVTQGQPLKVLRYQLVPIPIDGPKDPAISRLVANSREDLEKQYGGQALYEPIGFAEVPLEVPGSRETAWGNFVAQTLQDAAQADLSVDTAEFFGEVQPAGPITRETLFEGYPRTFNPEKLWGWNVWSFEVRGWVLSLAFTELTRWGNGFRLNTSGLTFDNILKNGKHHAVNFKVGGEKLKMMKKYRVGVAEGIGRGSYEMVALLKLFFHNAQDTQVPIWKALEAQLKKVGGKIRAPARAP
ncbi:metallophosphoesterase, partial [Bdellovibrionota bacterium FG-2]